MLPLVLRCLFAFVGATSVSISRHSITPSCLLFIPFVYASQKPIASYIALEKSNPKGFIFVQKENVGAVNHVSQMQVQQKSKTLFKRVVLREKPRVIGEVCANFELKLKLKLKLV
jgi:hypothetical protein